MGLHSAAARLPLQLLVHPLLPLRRGGNIRFVRGHRVYKTEDSGPVLTFLPTKGIYIQNNKLVMK